MELDKLKKTSQNVQKYKLAFENKVLNTNHGNFSLKFCVVEISIKCCFLKYVFSNFRRRGQRRRCARLGCECTNHYGDTYATYGCDDDEDEPLACDDKPTNVKINNVHVTINIDVCKCGIDKTKLQQVLTVVNKETDSEELLKIIENVLKKTEIDQFEVFPMENILI